MYRTGDLARYRRDGVIEFLGRRDRQVKIRGHRVELDEIEAVLASHPAVRKVAVVAREERPGDQRIVAYVVPAAGHTPDIADWQHHAGTMLPEYMVPAGFAVLERLPLTSGNKVDYRALQEDTRVMPPTAPQRFVAPHSETERRIAKVWREILGVERVGLHDDFFLLGGHSLLAMQLASRMRQAFGVTISLRNLFAAPTVAKLAALIEKSPASLQPDVSPAVINGDVEEDLI